MSGPDVYPTHALSLKNPWAWLVVHPSLADPGMPIKNIENRDWKTSRRGRVFIHASQSKDDLVDTVMLGIMGNLDDAEHDRFLHGCVLREDPLYWPTGTLIPPSFGAIVGEVEIYAVVEDSESVWFEKSSRYGFCLRNPIVYPVSYPCRGMPGFFKVDDRAVLSMSYLLNNP